MPEEHQAAAQPEGLALPGRPEALEQERQAEQGAPAQAVLPVPLAEWAVAGLADPGARWEALKRGAQALAQEQAAQERARLEAAGLSPGEAALMAARQAAGPDLAAALHRSAEQWWRQAGAPLVAALEQAGRQLAESLRPLAERLAAADLEAELDLAALADLRARQEAALLSQAVTGLLTRLRGVMPDLEAELDLAALALLAGADPGPGPVAAGDLAPDLPADPDLPEAERAAALHRMVARRLAAVQVTAPGYQAVLADRVAARLAARPAGE